MQKIDLYRYDINGRVTVSPNPRTSSDVSTRTRLVADNGHTLTDGTVYVAAIDIKSDEVNLWREVRINAELEKLM